MLTYSTPNCLANTRSSSVKSPGICREILMPGESGSRGRPPANPELAPRAAAPMARTKARRFKVQLLYLIATPSFSQMGVVYKARQFGLNRLGQNAVPAFPVRTPDELVGFRRITGAQVDGVPLELLPGPVGHVAKVVRLGDPTGIQEV